MNNGLPPDSADAPPLLCTHGTFAALLHQERLEVSPGSADSAERHFNVLVERKMRQLVHVALLASQSAEEPMTATHFNMANRK